MIGAGCAKCEWRAIVVDVDVVVTQSVVAAAGWSTANAPSMKPITASTTGTDRGTRPRTVSMVAIPVATNRVAMITIDRPPLPVTGTIH